MPAVKHPTRSCVIGAAPGKDSAGRAPHSPPNSALWMTARRIVSRVACRFGFRRPTADQLRPWWTANAKTSEDQIHRLAGTGPMLPTVNSRIAAFRQLAPMVRGIRRTIAPICAVRKRPAYSGSTEARPRPMANACGSLSDQARNVPSALVRTELNRLRFFSSTHFTRLSDVNAAPRRRCFPIKVLLSFTTARN